MPHRLISDGRIARLALLAVITVTGVAAQGGDEAVRRPVAVDELPVPEPSLADFRGTWRYVFTNQRARLEPDAAEAIAAAVRAARDRAPEHAIAWMVREEEGLLTMASAGGRAAVDFSETYTMVVGDAGHFYERRDQDGGWQPDATIGYTEQLLVNGDDTIHRVDVADPDIASPFYVIPRDAEQHQWDRCLLLSEWFEHAEILRYSIARGEPAGDRLVVSPERFLERPPYGVSCPLVGNRIVATVQRDGGRIAATITLFDGTGRTCKEWRSSWVGGRPLELMSRSYFSAGPQLDAERSIRVLERASGTAVPDLQQIATLPYERRLVDDERTDPSTTFDPIADGLPGRSDGAGAEQASEDVVGAGASVAPPGRAPIDAPPLLDRIPARESTEPAAVLWPWLLAGGLLIVAVFALWRRSVAPAVGVLLAFGMVPGCGPTADVEASRPASPPPAFVAAVEFAPESLRVAPTEGVGQFRRMRWHVASRVES